METAKRLVFINSHPIQYFAPLYQYITSQYADRFALTVLYLSDETVRGHHDRQFGTDVRWDVPLLEGYTYRFVPNRSWKPSLYNGFFGLINWGLIRELRQMPRSLVVCHGWEYAANIITLLAARAFGHVVCLRGDNPLRHEAFKPALKRFLRKLFLNAFVFAPTHYCLYVGEQNRQLYRAFNIRPERLVFTPHAVDNARFRRQFTALAPQRETLKQTMGLAGRQVLLFVGKLIPKKRPMDVVQAVERLRATFPALALVLVGEGELRPALERYVTEQHLSDVCITGFVNQQRIAEYYTVADVFVMCSGEGETWGLAVNEAMNFDLPLVLTDLTGSSDDLVDEGRNGYVVPTGNVAALADRIGRCLNGAVSGQLSGKRVRQYSYDALIAGLDAIPV